MVFACLLAPVWSSGCGEGGPGKGLSGSSTSSASASSMDEKSSSSASLETLETSEADSTQSTGSQEATDEVVPTGILPPEPSAMDLSRERSSLAREVSPSVSFADYAALRTGSNDLGFDLLRGLSVGYSNNAAVSSVSLQSGMGMLFAAARSATHDEMLDAFGFGLPQARVHPVLNLLHQTLAFAEEHSSDPNSAVFVRSVSRLVLNPETPLAQSYLDILGKHYGAEVYRANFAQNSSEVRRKINSWVGENTKDKIPKLFPDDSITASTKWVMANALYFKAPWTHQFKAHLTAQGSFEQLDGSSKLVPMMHGLQKASSYGENPEAQWATLDLGKKNILKAVVVVPRRGKFQDVQAALSNETMRSMLGSSTNTAVDLKIPKFQIETGTMPLAQILADRGARQLFSDQADLSGASEDGKGGLSPQSHLMQSVFIAIDENGVEAAAATGGASTDDEEDKIQTLVVDRPFFFLIYDQRSGFVLFHARVMSP